MRKYQWIVGIVALMGCMVSCTGCEQGQKMMEPEPELVETEEMLEESLTIGKIYWTQTDGMIRRANPDGSNVEDIVTDIHDPDFISFLYSVE